MTLNIKPNTIVWLTDIHCNFCSVDTLVRLCKKIKAENPAAVVITGDISEAQSLETHLRLLELEIDPTPVFFVCGNHDYYNGSIYDIREALLNNRTYPDYEKGGLYKGAYWLGSSGVVPLSDTTCLVGHDGWWDGGYANWFTSRVDMNDYYCITELNSKQCPLRELRYAKLQELAKCSADYIRLQLEEAFIQNFKTVYMATHVPPFKESSVYNGKISDDDWLPHFSSKVMGDTLLDVMSKHPDKHCVVLCGHTHGEAYYSPLKNLEVHTGTAQYHYPDIANIFIL